MAQPNKYTPQTNFAGDVRANKPGRDLINAGALDRELRYIRVTANGLCDNLALLQRDDGKLKDAVVGVHTLHKDVLMLLGKYELFGLWEANRPYLQGYVVEHEGKLYVCAESHDANDAMDLSKFKAFGAAGGGALTGDYLPVNWAESFFADDADGLTAAGVYVLADNGEASYLVVLGNGDNIGQLRITPAGLRVRFQTASGWGEWVDLSKAADVKLPMATSEQAGIVLLENDYKSKKTAAASLVALSSLEMDLKTFTRSEIIKGGGGATGENIIISDVPVGSIMYFNAESAPVGYLAADGTAVLKKDYPKLYAVIGDRYKAEGAAIGAEHFRLPDLRGEFIRGLDGMRGVDSNRALGSRQGDAVRNVKGGFVVPDNMFQQHEEWSKGRGQTPIDKNPFFSDVSKGRFGYGDQNDATVGGWFAFDMSRTVPTADEVRPRNVALLACIKAVDGRGMEATDEMAGLVKLYQTASGHERAIDGALSVRGAKALAEESSKWQSLTGVPDSFKPSEHRHGWAEIDDKPSKFTPAAHKHTWADITGAPKWVLKSDYEAKIEALEARLAALENPAGG